MKPKTIAVALLFLSVPFVASAAEARERAAKEKRIGASPAPAAAPADPPRAGSRDPQPPPESAGAANSANTANVDRTDGERDGDHAEGPEPDGFTIGARVGYALPMGTVAKDANTPDLSRNYSGLFPFWADIGYRINPRWYVGGYFQFAIAGTAGDVCNRAANGGSCSSSGTDIRFGALARYAFPPGKKNLSPWIGVSTGYEIASMSTTAGSNTSDTSVKGWEFIGLHLGVDYRPTPELSIGPMIMASFGQYQSYSSSGSNNGASNSGDFNNTALHEWIFLGLRGQYDL
jgi:hypothetical protein